jgi:GDP-L-fucose synthase
MKVTDKIYIAGHRGLVGSAITKRLKIEGFEQLLTRAHDQLDLTNQAETDTFFSSERPEYVFLAAAFVGGILANNTFPADFIARNLAIQLNVIRAAHANGVRRLIFLGSSCIYPKFAPQPMRERDLLTGPLEATNRPYALAKIAGVELCWSYNRQFATKYVALMPTNLYGPGDNYDLQNSHVIPALLRKFHEAKLRQDPHVVIWGTGLPRREFLYSDDMADACVTVMNLPDHQYDELLGSDEAKTGEFVPPLINVGTGIDVTITELAHLIQETTDYQGSLVFDASKPDGTPRKLMDVSRLAALGWSAPTSLQIGLKQAYADFRARLAT